MSDKIEAGDDAAWERALNCAASQLESYARQNQLATPEQRRAALDDVLQHAVGLLRLSALPAQGGAQLREALENIALLDEADGHELQASHALEAIAIATKALGKHPSEIHTERYAFPAQGEIARVREALEFYADPATYHAIAFLGDAPCGDFTTDFSEDDWTASEMYDRPMPGKRARAALLSAPQAQGRPPDEQWLIRKNGYFYRQNRQGYTNSIYDAGLYTEDEARAEARVEDSITAHHISECRSIAEVDLERAKRVISLIEASPPHPASASRGKVGEKKEVSGSRL